ncbi:MAG: ChaN family lipoprotein [Acidobacteriota bacterium]|nr:ChaN family lipoprotein [Acidobacteriota bacterium]
MKKAFPIVAALALLIGGAAIPAAAQAPTPVVKSPDETDATYLLKLGDPRFKDKTVDVAVGQIVSMETGKTVAFEQMIREMKPVPFVHIGETHTSLAMHELQARIIAALLEQDRRLAVGLEMYPVTQQEALTKWSLGILTEAQFIREGLWYTTWNQNYAFYKPIFDVVKAGGLPLYALNAPREIISKIRMRGWDALSEPEKAIVPNPDLTNAEHRELMKAVFSNEGMPAAMRGTGSNAMFEGLYRGQSAWDEVMGANAVRAHRIDGRKVVVLVGSGHLIYNLGLNRRSSERSKLPFKTVVAVPVPMGQATVKVARTLADYIVGIQEEARPAYPSIGLGFSSFEGLDNLVIASKPSDGAALGQGFEKGDVVLSVDGRSFTDANELRTYLAGFGWDAEIKFKLLRSGLVKDVVLKLTEIPLPATRAKS